jgi:nuclear protein 1
MEDKYEHYNYDQDRFVNGGHSGKNRSKREANEHTNRFDTSGHTRKLVTKLHNTETNNRK